MKILTEIKTSLKTIVFIVSILLLLFITKPIKTIQRMKKENKILILIALSYLIPVLTFGNFDIIDGPFGKFCYNYIALGVSLPVLFFMVVKKSRRKQFDYYLMCILLAMFISIFKLKPFTLASNKTLLGLSFPFSNIIGYWVCFFTFAFLYMMYKQAREDRYKQEFSNDPVLIQRDEKIDKILNW